jgi:DNA polymerase-3 subunit delta'
VNSVINQLNSLLKSGQAAHAYIVEARESELSALLQQCAKAVLTFGANSPADIARRVDFGVHQDCISMPLGGRQRITVEDIATLVEESYRQPVDASSTARVFTLNAAQSCAGAAGTVWQNKLLKTLEEPPSKVYIFIGVISCDGLLDTTKSRCQVLTQGVDSVADIAAALYASGIRQDIAEIYAQLSGGSLAEARKMTVDNDILRMFNSAVALLTQLTSTKESLRYVAEMLSFKGRTVEYLRIIAILLWQSVYFRVEKSLFSLSGNAADIKRVAENYSIEACYTIIAKIDNTKELLDAAGNVTLLLDNLVTEILEVRYRCRV